jgi:hypothetical protein
MWFDNLILYIQSLFCDKNKRKPNIIVEDFETTYLFESDEIDL